MEKSVFLKLLDIQHDHPNARFTGLQREMLGLYLQASPTSTMGEALSAVFEYIGEEFDDARLEAVARRLIEEQGKEEAAAPKEEKKVEAQSGSTFGKALIDWIVSLSAASRILAGSGLDFQKARAIYCDEDYTVTDELVALFLEKEWQRAVVQLEAACTPWSGDKGKKADEVYDMSQATDDDSQWQELAGAFAAH